MPHPCEPIWMSLASVFAILSFPRGLCGFYSALVFLGRESLSSGARFALRESAATDCLPSSGLSLCSYPARVRAATRRHLPLRGPPRAQFASTAPSASAALPDEALQCFSGQHAVAKEGLRRHCFVSLAANMNGAGRAPPSFRRRPGGPGGPGQPGDPAAPLHLAR